LSGTAEEAGSIAERSEFICYANVLFLVSSSRQVPNIHTVWVGNFFWRSYTVFVKVHEAAETVSPAACPILNEYRKFSNNAYIVSNLRKNKKPSCR